MEKFTIEISQTQNGPFGHPICMQMEPGEKVMEIAEALSKAYPKDEVIITMGGCPIRRKYVNGEIIFSNPTLTKFYVDVDPQDEWEWTCLGQVKD
jgi:hypothetical protein